MKSVMTSALVWYQKKIGAYDKQSWEKTVDQRILRGVSAVPKKIARVKTELIDVDLVRGSAFPKAKPQHSWIAATLSGVTRVLFLPIYFTWWQLQANTLVSCTLVILYVLQILAIYIFFSSDETEFSNVPTSEALTPAAMMLILGIVHSQIVATFSSKNSHKRVARTKRKRMKRKRMKSFAESESKSSPETASEDKGHIDVACSVLDSNANHSTECNCTSEPIGTVQAPKSAVSKKASDDESGLDVTDNHKNSFNPTINKCHNDSRCFIESSKTVCCHHTCISKCPHKKPNDKESASFIAASTSHAFAHHFHNNIDADNVSSGEEYFVAKKPSFSNEQWKSYLLQMKHNGYFKKFCQTRSGIKGVQVSRRFSDIGPISAACYMRNNHQNEVRNSDDGFRSHTDPCAMNSVSENIEQELTLHGITKPGIRCRRPVPPGLQINVMKCLSSGESEPDTTFPDTPHKPQTSDLEWPLIANSDYNSDTSDLPSQSMQEEEESDTSPSENPFAWEMQESAATSFSAGGPSSDKVSCTIWERNECKKVDLSVLDISSAIIRKVDSSIPSAEYLAMGLLFASIITVVPLLFRLQSGTAIDSIQDVTLDVMNFTVPSTQDVIQILQDMVEVMLGSNWSTKSVVLIFMLERFTLSLTYFFLLSVAEKTFKQRFLYAKNFCYLTSSRRARRTDLPHFRLNKVRNIKTWLSVRSYLKKSGPQRSVDVIVSVAFILEVCVLSFLCVQLLKETGQFASKLHCWEILVWTLALGFFLLRFMIIGSKINKKYRNLSVLITEQINLYLHMEQKPHKKNELMLANSVLKLAADLLKELESPFKISGLSANPLLYNFTKVVVLSAFSAVLTEVLGFKLKLYKMKLK